MATPALHAIVAIILVSPPAADGPEPAAPVRADTVRSPAPAIPTVRLAPVDGFATESAYLADITRRAERFTAIAATSEHNAARARLHLAAANVLLAKYVEPTCTRWLLGIIADDTTADAGPNGSEADPDATGANAQGNSAAGANVAGANVADTSTTGTRKPAAHTADANLIDIMGRVHNALASATRHLDAAPAGGRTDVAEQKTLAQSRDTLEAFAAAVAALLAASADERDNARLRRAASAVSGLLEDSDPAVAAAAALYQAALRSEAGDLERALNTLDLALAPPPRGAMPLAFFARLYRCRLIARRGGHAVALALLYQMEERCHEWFVGDARQADALRTVTVVELGVLRDWHDRLKPGADSAERAWCAETMSRLISRRLTDHPPTVLRLVNAVPIVVPPPAGLKSALDAPTPGP
ncbi:MAG: hypothetical protein ACE5E6_08270 [Phycisphaerae bacterium]